MALRRNVGSFLNWQCSKKCCILPILLVATVFVKTQELKHAIVCTLHWIEHLQL